MPAYTILHHPLPQLHLVTLCVCVCASCIRGCTCVYLCNKVCNFAMPSDSVSQRLDPSTQIISKGSPRLWKVCARARCVCVCFFFLRSFSQKKSGARSTAEGLYLRWSSKSFGETNPRGCCTVLVRGKRQPQAKVQQVPLHQHPD